MGTPNVFRRLLPSHGPAPVPRGARALCPSHAAPPPPPPPPDLMASHDVLPPPEGELPRERYRPDTTMVGVDEPQWEALRQQLVDRIATSPYIPEALKPSVAVMAQRGIELPRLILEIIGQPESVATPGVVAGTEEALAAAAPRLAHLAASETGAVQIPGRGLGRLTDAIDPRSVRSLIEPVRLRDIVKDRFAGFEQLAQDLPFRSDWRGSRSPTIRRAFDYNQPDADRWGYYLASTSPANMVPGNTKESAASQWFRLRYPDRPFALADLSNERFPTKYGNPGSKWQNLNRADRGERLSGEKVNAFGGFNTGSNEAAIDRHYLYAMGVRPNDPKGTEILLQPEFPALKRMFEERLGHTISKQDAYEMLSGAVSDAVQELNPRAVFQDLYGDVWEGAKAHKGEPFVGGPPDILKAVGLGGRGAMLDVDLLEEVLREGSQTPGFWTAKRR